MSGLRVAWRSSYDAAGVSLTLGLLGVAMLFVPREVVMFGVPGLNETVFIVVPTLLSLWLGMRLWALARLDSGPSRLFMLAFVGLLLYVAYTLVTRGQLPQGSPDSLALAIRWTGAGFGAAAVLRWKRLPAWLGWTLVAILVLEVIEVLAQQYTGSVLVTLVYALETLTSFGLALALIRNPVSVATDAEVHLTRASTSQTGRVG